MDGPSYKSMPALAAYVDRIGAEQLNFRKFIVKEHRGKYYLEKAVIKLNADGTIVCRVGQYAPTKDEADEIKGEVKKAADKWPKAVMVKSIDGLKELTGEGPLYEFYDNSRNNIIMVQERIQIDGSAKDYVPWTKFSDGEWRRMEPDTDLPLWKPPTKRKKARIMIHEGAKAAQFIDDLLHNPKRKKERDAHPWIDYLEDFEHWGMIGGALAPHRTNYGEITKEKPVETVYVCDNDSNGKRALQIVSKCYGRPLKGIKFTQSFEEGWDLADPMPPKLFRDGRWVGPPIKKLLTPATYATDRVNIEGTKKTVAVISKYFADEWVHSVTPDAYIHKDMPAKILNEKEFNDKVAPYSDIADTSRLIKQDDSIKTAIIKYMPALPFGVYESEVGFAINTHMSGDVEPAKKGDYKLWCEYCEHLIPDETDRHEFYRWVATFIAMPERKMNYGMLLISETQGVGKSTLGESILQPIIGRLNVSFPTEGDIVDSDYNYWMAHKRLAFVNEIYAGHSSKAYNKLKDVITAKQISIRQKYIANYDIDNWVHCIACSNNLNALKLSNDDRRWLVPAVTEIKQTDDFWEVFHTWLSDQDGLSLIMKWAVDFLKKNKPVGSGENAPMTKQKQEVIEAGYSEGQKLVADTLRRVMDEAEDEKWLASQCKPDGANGEWELRGGLLIHDVAFQGLIKDVVYEGRRNDFIEKPLTIRKIAKGHGWHVHPDKVMIDKVQGRLICSERGDTERPARDLLDEKKPIDVRKLGNDWRQM